MAGFRLAGVAAGPPAVVPPDAAGPRCGSARRRGHAAPPGVVHAGERPVADPVIPAGALAAVLDDLRSTARGLRVLIDPIDRESYRLDATDYLTAGLPGAVVLPTTTAEVAAIVAAAARHGMPVVPRGAGTGLSGGAAGIEGALTISLMRMNRIVEIDADNLCAVVQ